MSRLDFLPALLAAVCVLPVGCTTTASSDTARTATEQLLISHAVDDSLDKVDFRPFAGHRVFLDESRLKCTDQEYVVSSLRHRLLLAGAQLAPAKDDAEVVVEVRSGGVGTDRKESFVGIPEIAAPGPVPVAIPEIKLWSTTKQSATAKIGLVAYDARTGSPFGKGGVTLANSNESNFYFMGMGPLQRGSVRKQKADARRIEPRPAPYPERVAFESRPTPLGSRIRLTGEEEDDDQTEEPTRGARTLPLDFDRR